MRYWPLKYKLLLINLLISFVLLLVTSVVLIQLASDLSRKASQQQYQQILAVLDQDLIRAVVFSKPDQISDLMRKLRSFRSLQHLYLYNAQGMPVLAYHRDQTNDGPPPGRVKTATTPLFEANHLIARTPLRYEGRDYGEVQIVVEMPAVSRFIHPFLPHLAYLIPLLLGLSLLLALWLQRPIIEPIEWLTRKLLWMANNRDYQAQIPPRGRDAIGQLYSGVRTLTEVVRQSQTELQQNLERLQQIFDHITDLIMEFDASGRILSTNQAARNLWRNTETPLQSVDQIMLLPQKDLLPLELRHLARTTSSPLHLSGLSLVTDQQESEVELHLLPLERQEAEPHYLLVIHPLSDEQQLQQALEQQATTDRLTGLANRMELERALNHALQWGKTCYLLHLDIDRFHLLNEACSFQEGDRILVDIAHLLQSLLPADALLARIGGDEFAILLHDREPAQIHSLAGQLLEGIHQKDALKNSADLPITLSIGIASSKEGQELSELLKNADASRQIAKQQGGNRYHFYQANDERLIQHNEELALFTRIINGLNQHRLRLFYQRIEPASGEASDRLHFETLSRIQCENGDWIPPGLFMPVAERYQLAIEIDIQIIQGVFHWFEQHPQLLEHLSQVTINLSGSSLGNPRLETTILGHLQQGPLKGEQLCFELTETSAIENLQVTQVLMQKLRAQGCRFSLDDFGTGMSSLAYLKQFPADYLKLDGSFIQELETDPTNQALVRIFTHIGQVFGMQTVAEFVENESIRQKVQALGVDLVQGYGIHKPEPFEHMLDET